MCFRVIIPDTDWADGPEWVHNPGGSHGWGVGGALGSPFRKNLQFSGKE